MPATPITASSRYINPGTTKVYWATSIANKSAPTRAELNAAIDVTGELADNKGWMVSSDVVDAPTMDSRFTAKIPGRTDAKDSSLTFYADSTGSDARTLMPLDTNGFVIWLDGGDVTGRKCDVFPVRVASVGKERSTKGSDPATVPIEFAITAVPAQDVVIP
ncbi:phage tail tube protein [Actinomadura rupiterrae]|uniref:phage tail tube protein n=1 Tax=Actinomadura rupiterrae TaxID=559627 RepID=UPI0020A5F429|nr:hypothetical protein [Actinomadura rupiterrae]MCP2339162.1 hypothetical protein [Actinomadura rupiterrae]